MEPVQDPEAKAAKMKELLKTTFAVKVRMLESVLTTQPGPFITGDELTYADFHVFSYIGQFLAGMFGIPKTLFDAHPEIERYRKMMASHPDVAAFYAAHAGDEDFMSSRGGFLP
jgi:glutathione S-transferase